MCPWNKVSYRTRALPVRRGRAILMALLLVGLALPVLADNFDAVKGRRMLGIALASSAMEHSQGQDISTPRTPEQLLFMFLINPRYNAYLLKHPEVIPSLLDRMAEPGFLVATYQSVLHPEAYLHFLEGWTDVEKMRGYFETIDPAVLVTWAHILTNPGFYMALYEPLIAPRKLQAWINFMFGSRASDLLLPAFNPQTYLTWLTLPFNPALLRHIEGPLRLANPMQWFAIAGAVMQSSLQATQRFAVSQDNFSTSPGLFTITKEQGFHAPH